MSNFLHSVEEQLKSNKDKTSVMRELQDHVETKKEFFQSIGYDKKASAEKANEAMGDGEIIGQRLNKMHRSRTILSNIFSRFFLLLINLSLIYSRIPGDRDIFIITFLWSLIVLVINLCFTAITIKRKDGKLSAFLIVFSFIPFLARKLALSYPLCNFIFSFFNNYTNKIYNFFSIVIIVCLSAIIVIPNAFNIYHCKQIKELDNTRRQNEISRFMRNACVIVAVSSIILSVPYYAMNDLICKKQAELRDSLFAFALDTANEFDYNAWDELAKYLESCEYDFEYNVYNYYLSDSDVVAYRMERYSYCKGDWTVTFTLDDKELKNGYYVDVNHNIDNLSLKHLYITAERKEEIFKKIGNPYDGTGNVTGLSTQEIRSIMNDHDFTGISIKKQKYSTVYTYEFFDARFMDIDLEPTAYFKFNFGSNNICKEYEYSNSYQIMH